VTEAWPRRLGSSAWQLSDALPLPLLANESIAEQPADIGALTAAYLSFSREFVLSAARRAQPWFLFVSFHQPHVPLAPSPRFCNRSAAGSYGDALLEMDEAIGELGRIVSEAGAARSTLTLFASDNGPWVEMAPAAGSAGPLRGGKFTTYEGGIRVPALAHLPGAVPAGRVTAAVASLLDVLPTAVRLAGGTPRAQLLDGRDLRPLLSGRSEASPHRCLFFFGGTPGAGCRGDRRRCPGLWAARCGDYKLHFATRAGQRTPPVARQRLYHVGRDAAESRPLHARRGGGALDDFSPSEAERSIARINASVAALEATLPGSRGAPPVPNQLGRGYLRNATLCCHSSGSGRRLSDPQKAPARHQRGSAGHSFPRCTCSPRNWRAPTCARLWPPCGQPRPPVGVACENRAAQARAARDAWWRRRPPNDRETSTSL